MTPKLHVGKLGVRIETSVTEAMDKWIDEQASILRVTAADYIRELLYLGATKTIYSVHVANDKAEVFAKLPATLPQECGK